VTAYKRVVLALCTLAFFATMVARLVISPVVPDIVAAFGTSNAAVGLALSAMWAAYALSQFPSGVLGDRFGERRVILAALATTTVTALALALSPSFPVFVLFAVALGAGAGLHYSVAASLLTKQFDAVGRAIGVHGAGAPLAGLLAPIAAALVGAAFGWRYAVAIGAVVAFAVLVAFALAIRPTPPSRPDRSIASGLDPRTLRTYATDRRVRYTTVIAICCGFSWQATASFLPAFLEANHGLSRTAAGVAFSGYFVVQGVGQPLLGLVTDRFGTDRAIAGAVAIAACGYALLVTTSGPVALSVSLLFVGVGMSWTAPVESRFMASFSDADRGSAFGLVRTVYNLVAASGSVVVGSLADLFGWAAAFGSLAVLLGALLALVVSNRLFGLGL